MSSHEFLSPNEVLTCLWSPDAPEKCRIGLVDAVIYEHGVPARWYITGKTGEITKKRNVDKEAISNRWKRINQQSNSQIVAIVRRTDGFLSFLGNEAWEEFLKDWNLTNHEIMSVHCFVKGSQPAFFRNSFEVKDRLGRFFTSTKSYSYVLNSEDGRDVNQINEKSCTFIDIKASSLRNIMDLATSTIIKYLELILNVKILNLAVDYVVDSKSQLWMVWSSKATYVRGSNLQEAATNLPSGEGVSRMSWAGSQYSLHERASTPLSKPPSSSSASRLNKKSSTQTLNQSKLNLKDNDNIDSNITNNKNITTSNRSEFQQVKEQIQSAVSVLTGSPNQSKTKSRKQLAVMHDIQSALPPTNHDSSLDQPSSLLSIPAETQPISTHSFSRSLTDSMDMKSQRKSQLPLVFQCKGEFCHLKLNPKGALALDESHQHHAIESLFTEKELKILKKYRRFNELLEDSTPTGPPGQAMISLKSIILATEERRLQNEEASATQMDWKAYPNTSRTTLPSKESKGGDERAGLAAGQTNRRSDNSQSDVSEVSGLVEESVHSFHSSSVNGPPPSSQGLSRREIRSREGLTESDTKKNDILSKDREKQLDFNKNMAKYYEDVRVCNVCHRIYTTLDWARQALGQGDAYGAGLSGNTLLSKPKSPSPGSAKRKLRSDGKETSLTSSSSVPYIHPRDKRKGTTNMEFSRSTSPNSSMSPTTQDMSNIRPSSEQDRIEQQTHGVANTHSKSNKHQKPKRTWKDYSEEKQLRENSAIVSNDHDGKRLQDIDSYLRKGSKVIVEKREQKRAEKIRERVSQLKENLGESPPIDASTASMGGTKLTSSHRGSAGEGVTYHGKVLLACAISDDCNLTKEYLDEAYFDVTHVVDGRAALNTFLATDGKFDCVIVERDLTLNSAFDIAKHIRAFDKRERAKAAAEAAAEGKGIQPYTRRVPVICFTSATTPSDLKSYMQADMDGCVSMPVNKASLLSTVRAAIPHHLAVLAEPPQPPPPMGSKLYRLGPLGVPENSLDSSSLASKSISFGASADEKCSTNGFVQIDPDTRISYIVLNAAEKKSTNDFHPYFNLVICHDIFDTAERLKIFFKPLVQQYVGLQILLWNYPGQAFTEWREEQLLNSEFHTTCLNELLGQVGETGSKEFDTTKPFYILGYGFGANIASFYTAHFRVPNLRGLLLVNGWSFVDSNLAAALHDCISVFQCTPSARPDLPVYFFSRFLFSKEYLAKVSVPLALNIYTAVFNPITLKGRISLCKGALASMDLRPILSEIDAPIICIQGTQDTFSRSLHTEPYVSSRAGELRSIYRVLQDPDKTCVIWVRSGHEIFQECRKQISTLLQQILTGYHEKNDVSFPAQSIVDSTGLNQGLMINNFPGDESLSVQLKKSKAIEDKYIDNLLKGITRNSNPSGGTHATNTATSNKASNSGNKYQSGTDIEEAENQQENENSFGVQEGATWSQYSSNLIQQQTEYFRTMKTDDKETASTNKKTNKQKKKEDKPSIILDPTTVAFERQDNAVYAVNPADYPEVKEYMGWRLKRNKKRLMKLHAAAKDIQTAYRAYRARVYVEKLRRHRAAVTIQRYFRGWLGRCRFLEHARRIWAAQLIQRVWRGYAGRLHAMQYRMQIAAAVTIQKAWRGYLTRQNVNALRDKRNKAATKLQSIYRRNKAKRMAWQKRIELNAAIEIQRVYRGHLGKKKAIAERDRYIFSKSQTQGIEFGRQMLLEHKLHATRLQSDVALLTQEKVGAEEQVEALLEEIGSFEEGVRILEKEMHQLSKVESEAAAYLDEQSKGELREQKIRLDREFGEMLVKIGNRKEQLTALEHKLSSIDKSRQLKEEELRTLERKLVVLLEEQQNELNAIKRKQDVRGTLLAASHQQLMQITSGGGGSQVGGDNNSLALVSTSNGSGGGGSGMISNAQNGGGRSGPSMKERREAAQLMQSTETLMKFGFMSMSMTYFSSLNMIKALRTVSAQDTVMAALADVHAQRAVNFGMEHPSQGKSAGADVLGAALGEGPQAKGAFLPSLKPGQLPGQEVLRVSAWSVEDVSRWLQTQSLGQYCEAFIDAAIDGEFLYDLNDDDLKNTLGVEHRLHRKKILNSIYRLKVAEASKDSRVDNLLRTNGEPMMDPEIPASMSALPNNMDDAPLSEQEPGARKSKADPRLIEGPRVPFPELTSLVRHSKYSLVKEALDYLPNKKFERALVQMPFVDGFGTVYVEGYAKLVFHINMTDEYGNTLLTMAAQNGNMKIAKFLLNKGSNPNHQNKQGHTPAHFAIAYHFYEMSTWLFENGGDDSIENIFGRTPYDGITE